jgi:hypothetical protein
MVQFYSPPETVTHKWDQAVKCVIDQLTKELDRTKLFSQVGEPWAAAGPRYRHVQLKEALERIEKRKNYSVRFGSNPRLDSLNSNQSDLLNSRRQHVSDAIGYGPFDKLTDHQRFLQASEAFQKMLSRLGQAATEKQEQEVRWILNSIWKLLAQERIYAEMIEEPFYELEFQALLAGHLPCGVEGQDWKTCQILYC